jgi:dTDP-4-amino-4,6-dideoxygalactose transaminase
MIPRYAPTYTYNDLIRSLSRIPKDELEADISARISNLHHVKHVFLIKNARSGLYTILKAYNRPGRVLIPAYNCITVASAAYYAGYQPRFVETDINKLNSLPEMFDKMITEDTTAVIPTHLFGIPCNLEGILNVFKQKNILVVEDAAPALGAEYGGKKVGSFGDASVVSFGGRKVIYAEGGAAILTNNDDLAAKIHDIVASDKPESNQWLMHIQAIAGKIALTPMLYGIIRRAYELLREEQMYEIIPAKLEIPKGYSSKMPGFASKLLHFQLDRLEWNLSRRRKLAQIYREQLDNHSG